MNPVIIIATLGLIICLYAWYVDQKIIKDPSYRAACDISDAISCTKTFKSVYGKHFGVSNIIWGLIFYGGIIIVSAMGYHKLIFLDALLGILFSLYLAYILYFKVKTVCLICISIYVINIALLFASYANLS